MTDISARNLPQDRYMQMKIDSLFLVLMIEKSFAEDSKDFEIIINNNTI